MLRTKVAKGLPSNFFVENPFDEKKNNKSACASVQRIWIFETETVAKGQKNPPRSNLNKINNNKNNSAVICENVFSINAERLGFIYYFVLGEN
jgi:hypothetical protein